MARREWWEALVKREREGKEREEREEAELRGRLEEERRAVLDKVKRGLLARRDEAIKRVVAECDEAVAAELDRQDRELTKSRLRRLEAVSSTPHGHLIACAVLLYPASTNMPMNVCVRVRVYVYIYVRTYACFCLCWGVCPVVYLFAFIKTCIRAPCACMSAHVCLGSTSAERAPPTYRVPDSRGASEQCRGRSGACQHEIKHGAGARDFKPQRRVRRRV